MNTATKTLIGIAIVTLAVFSVSGSASAYRLEGCVDAHSGSFSAGACVDAGGYPHYGVPTGGDP